jgi:hypothetical protein
MQKRPKENIFATEYTESTNIANHTGAHYRRWPNVPLQLLVIINYVRAFRGQ